MLVKQKKQKLQAHPDFLQKVDEEFEKGKVSCIMRKQIFWFPTWSDTNQAVQLQKMARGLKFRT